MLRAVVVEVQLAEVGKRAITEVLTYLVAGLVRFAPVRSRM